NTEAVLVETNSTGPFTLIEFTRALPRAKLYTQWQSDTNNESALKTIASPSFDPEQTVVVAREMSAPPPVSTNAPAGTVQITNYEPIDIKLKSDAPSPTVLLLNDRYDPDW